MEGKLLDKARSIAQSVSGTVSSALEIRSPSRVMARIGEDATKGMIQGIERPMDRLNKSARRMAETAEDPEPHEPPEPRGYGGGQRGAYGYGGTTTNNSYGSQRHVTINIESVIGSVSVSGDADEDRLAAKIMEKLASLMEDAGGNMGEVDFA